MADNIISSVVTIATAVIGLAIIAVLVSRNAQTPQVISSAGAALANNIRAAVSPVSGGFGGFTSPTSYGGFTGSY